MIEVAATDEPQPRIDVCRLCHFVWFDADELAHFTPLAAAETPAAPELPAKAREALAMLQVEQLARQEEAGSVTEPPDELWKRIAALLGVPVLIDDANDPRPPWLTWSIAAAIAAVFAFTFRELDQAIAAWGLIPAEFRRHGGATFVSSFFLHGGILHAALNLYFLLVFGNNVEGHLSWSRYLLLITLASAAGDACHILLDPASVVPLVGASGGISGIIVFFALEFPRARIAIGFWRGPWTWFYRLPAWSAILLWVGLQAYGAREQSSGFTNVSAIAHLGGAAMGLLAWVAWRLQASTAAPPARSL